MTQALNKPVNVEQRRAEWIARVDALVTQIVEWAQEAGWTAERHTKKLSEKLLGEYEIPQAVIRVPGGEVQVNPIALRVVGADGRVDLDATPTLSRVKLLGREGGWEIMTDSNVPLRLPWDYKTFVQLVQDLLG